MPVAATRADVATARAGGQSAGKAARFLEQALLATFVIHAIAMGAMLLLLLPGMPGGGASDAARA